MASLHTVQQVQLQKPLQAASNRGKWNSMHARIARYIQEQQTKNKVKKRKSSLSNRCVYLGKIFEKMPKVFRPWPELLRKF